MSSKSIINLPLGKTFAAILSLTCLAVPHQAEAGILIEFSEQGSDVHYSSSGSFDIGGLTGPLPGFHLPGVLLSGSAFATAPSFSGANFVAGITANNLGLPITIKAAGADTGFLAVTPPILFIPGTLTFQPSDLSGTTLTPVFSGTFPGESLISLGLTPLLDGGPVVAFTNPTNGDTISYGITPVPEPSGSLFLAMLTGATTLMLRHRRTAS